jgi:hypothetical protein
MIKKYVKRPITIEALQWDGENRRDLWDFCSLAYFNTDFETGELKLFIRTLEGAMEASKGDYIIKGIQGEFYACKPDIFKLTYDELHSDSDTE